MNKKYLILFLILTKLYSTNDNITEKIRKGLLNKSNHNENNIFQDLKYNRIENSNAIDQYIDEKLLQDIYNDPKLFHEYFNTLNESDINLILDNDYSKMNPIKKKFIKLYRKDSSLSFPSTIENAIDNFKAFKDKWNLNWKDMSYKDKFKYLSTKNKILIALGGLVGLYGAYKGINYLINKNPKAKAFRALAKQKLLHYTPHALGILAGSYVSYKQALLPLLRSLLFRLRRS